MLSVVRVNVGGGPAITYRQNQTWVSYVTMLVSQEGFPWGRAVLDQSDPSAKNKVNRTARFADPGRFSSLAILYSHFADSDAVKRLMLRDGPLRGKIEAAPVLASDNG